MYVYIYCFVNVMVDGRICRWSITATIIRNFRLVRFGGTSGAHVTRQSVPGYGVFLVLEALNVLTHLKPAPSHLIHFTIFRMALFRVTFSCASEVHTITAEVANHLAALLFPAKGVKCQQQEDNPNMRR